MDDRFLVQKNLLFSFTTHLPISLPFPRHRPKATTELIRTQKGEHVQTCRVVPENQKPAVLETTETELPKTTAACAVAIAVTSCATDVLVGACTCRKPNDVMRRRGTRGVTSGVIRGWC